MKVTRFLVSLLFLGVASNAFAAGSVSVNWDTCVGPIDKAVAPGSIVAANMSVLGQDQPHQAYQVQLSFGGPGGLRDAWRFDPAGCQGSSFITINHLAPAALSKTCPTFQGSFASVQVKDYAYDALTGKARLALYNAYPPNNSVQIIPTTRYFLGQAVFDHTFSVVGPGAPGETCGGVEAAVCVHIISATWLTPAGEEIPWAISNEFVTANDAQNASRCPGATPATTTTWGSLKNQYR